MRPQGVALSQTEKGSRSYRCVLRANHCRFRASALLYTKAAARVRQQEAKVDPKRGCVVRSDVAQCSASRRASDGGESLAPTAGLPTSFATSESAALNFVVGGAKILADLAGGAGSGSGVCAGRDARGCRAGAAAAAAPSRACGGKGSAESWQCWRRRKKVESRRMRLTPSALPPAR